MQQYISRDTLLSLGVTEADIDRVLKELNEKVELQIGDEVIESLNDEDTQALVDLQETMSDEELASWIVERVPDYKEIVQDNINIVLGEFAETLPSDAE